MLVGTDAGMTSWERVVGTGASVVDGCDALGATVDGIYQEHDYNQDREKSLRTSSHHFCSFRERAERPDQ